MSSTDMGGHETEIRDLFERLMAIRRSLEAQNRSLFPLHPAPALDSYYKRRSTVSARREDFDLRALDSMDAFERGMVELWHGQNQPELIDLASSVAALASKLQQTEEQAEDVSPFMYVMF